MYKLVREAFVDQSSKLINNLYESEDILFDACTYTSIAHFLAIHVIPRQTRAKIQSAFMYFYPKEVSFIWFLI